MTKTLDVARTETLLIDLVALARQGTEVLLTEGDRPLARLVPIAPALPKQRTAGLHTGAAQMSKDFNAPLPEEFWMGIE